MLLKKNKAIIASALSAMMVASTMMATVASAATTADGTEVAGSRTKAEAFGDDTYAERFLSLYDDVMTNGQENGYLSSNNGGSGSFGIPYHAVEEVIVEAPDYGHETTSEAMSYLVWVAAMRDNIATNMTDQVDEGTLEYTADLAKAWKTMEVMIPTIQNNFWSGSVSAQYCGEYDNPEDCPDLHAAESWKTASNPIHSYFTSAYSSDSGLYLMHWLADVENWYGFGSGTSFTFINTFQRGEQESCWETVPHPCVEELKYGNAQEGLKGIFNKDAQVAKQYAYTNAPDAEDRAIQAVYDANRWGVGDSNVTALAAKMGDELRNNMFDKYYQAIGENTSWANGNAGYDSAHYLMNWYTSWGGAYDPSQNWIWQIGCSHAHEFYQNPLAAFALIQDADLKSGMKAQGAVTDYTTSLERQMEFYLWLQSNDGPIAGGATNSYKGRYEPYPSGISTFYGMMYTEHPVYADPGSNHWIGNQVWAVQRLAELYYWVLTEGDTTGVNPGGMSLEAALEQILDKWCAWFVNNTVLTDDGDYYIPATLNWSGQPDDWNMVATDNEGLTCEVSAYGQGDLGCVSSLANTLIYYAKAKGATAADLEKTYDCIGSAAKAGILDGVEDGNGQTIEAGDAELAGASLYLAQQLLDREWDLGRDDIGLSRPDYNKAFARMFAQPVHIPSDYTGTMPNQDAIKSGITFIDIRSMYLDSSKCMGVKTSEEALALVQELKAAYEADVANGAEWSGDYSASSAEGSAEMAKFENVGSIELNYHRFWHAGDILMALGTMAELYPEIEPTIQYGDVDTSEDLEVTLWGDANVDDDVTVADVITVNKYYMKTGELSDQGFKNADVDIDEDVDLTDSLNILKSLIDLVELPVTAQ